MVPRIALALASLSVVAHGKDTLSCTERSLVETQIPLVESALDPTDRLRAVSTLADAARAGRKAYEHLSDADWKKVEAALLAWDAVKARAAEFEGHLSTDAMEAATAGEPKSLARSVNRLYLASTATCSEQEFKKLEKTVGLGRLAILGSAVAQAAYYADRGHDHARAEALAAYLTGEEEEEPGATELAAYYRVLAEGITDSPDDADYKKWEDEQREKIRTNRVRPEDIDKTIAEMVRLAPGCFLGAAREREAHEALAITKARGQLHLEELKYLLGKGERPTDSMAFKTPEDATILEERWDGWREDYRVRYEGNKATLYSFGPDQKNGTDDDIVIGTVPVPPKH